MRKLFAIAFKDILVRFTSPIEWLFFIILPIVFTVVIGATSGPTGDGRVKMYVVDQAQNTLSVTLIDALESSTAVRPELKSYDEAMQDFDDRKISSVLVIPAEFDENALQSGSAELQLNLLPNNTEALVVDHAVQAVLGKVSSVVDIAAASLARAESVPGSNLTTSEDRQTYFDAALEQASTLMSEAPVRLTESTGNTKTMDFDARTNASAGQMITWVFIPLIGLSATFAYERQKGTLRRVLTTPTSKGLYLAGTITGQVITALFQMLLLILFGIFVMKLNWATAPGALAVMLVASALAAAALGTMLGSFVKTEGQANGLSIMIGMVMALMGGCWYPLELFPRAVQSAVKVLPTTWSMQGLLDIVLRGQGLAGILPEASILMGFALLFFVIGILRFKYE